MRYTRRLVAVSSEAPARFRKWHSTQTPLLYVNEHVRLAIDKHKLTLLTPFDFSKAFDTVPHAPLLRKLRSLSCDDNVIRWFAYYLRGRERPVLGSYRLQVKFGLNVLGRTAR